MAFLNFSEDNRNVSCSVPFGCTAEQRCTTHAITGTKKLSMRSSMLGRTQGSCLPIGLMHACTHSYIHTYMQRRTHKQIISLIRHNLSRVSFPPALAHAQSFCVTVSTTSLGTPRIDAEAQGHVHVLEL